MGDALGSVFGSGSNTTQNQTPDPTSQALNQLRLNQMQQLFNQSSVSDFAGNRSDLYTPSQDVMTLLQQAMGGGNNMSLDSYLNLGLNEGSNYISQVATPQIMQSAALQGLEGGGFVPEAIGKATAGIALPFLQSIPGFQAASTQRTSSLFPIADYGRSLQEQDFLRQQGLVTTGLTGLPYTPTTDTNIDESSQPLFNWFGQG